METVLSSPYHSSATTVLEGHLWHSFPHPVEWGLRLFSNSLWDLEHLYFRAFSVYMMVKLRSTDTGGSGPICPPILHNFFSCPVLGCVGLNFDWGVHRSVASRRFGCVVDKAKDKLLHLLQGLIGEFFWTLVSEFSKGPRDPSTQQTSGVSLAGCSCLRFWLQNLDGLFPSAMCTCPTMFALA